MPFAFHDGKIVPRESLSISPADYGFARGVTVFDLARVYGGVPFHLDDHLARFAEGARTLGIAMPMDAAGLTQAAHDLIARHDYDHSMIKFYLTAGECRGERHAFPACHDFAPHLMIVESQARPAHPEAPYGPEDYRKGQAVKTVPFERELPLVKSTNYMLGYYASCQYAGAAWDDILFTHRDGYVTEATRSNVFFVIDGKLCTPGQGVLRGITRKILIKLAAEQGIAVQEGDFRPADLARATEAFTSGSYIELFPIKRLDDHVLPTTTDGPVYGALRRAFSDYIRDYCARAKGT